MSDKYDEMARECASLIVYEMLYNAREPMYPAEDRVTQRIAALVRREVERARADERDACAKVCDHWGRPRNINDMDLDDSRWKVKQAAAAIRARG